MRKRPKKGSSVLDAQRVTELAEAVVDGLTPDWRSEEGSSADPIERGVISKLKAVQAEYEKQLAR